MPFEVALCAQDLVSSISRTSEPAHHGGSRFFSPRVVFLSPSVAVTMTLSVKIDTTHDAKTEHLDD